MALSRLSFSLPVLLALLLVVGPALTVPLRPDGEQPHDQREAHHGDRRGLQSPSCLIITGVIDGPLPSGLPKAIELYATCDAADPSVYGLGSANNGAGTDGQEFAFPASPSIAAGQFVYVTSQSAEFETFFGFTPDYTASAANINGDDAIELFQDGTVVDTLGDINVDGSGQPWEYMDGWAYRKSGTGPDGSTFDLANWLFSGPNALDGEATNADASSPFPIQTYGGADSEMDSPPSAPPSAPAAPTPIHEIQGNGAASPLAGETVRTSGVVSFVAPNLDGFFIQTPAGDEDSDEDTSEGLFIFVSRAPQVHVGDLVHVRGEVVEFNGLTELTSVSSVEVEATGLTVTQVSINPEDAFPTRADTSPAIEKYEGMLLKLTTPIYVTEFFNFDRFGEIWLSPDPVQLQYTQLNAPSTTGAPAYINALQDVVYLDDASTVSNPSSLPFPKPEFSVSNSFRLGDKVMDLVAPLTFGFGNYRLLVDAGSQYSLETINPRPLTPPAVGGRLKVASFNVLNYFTTIDVDGATSGPNALGPRGADTYPELERQGEKLVTAMIELDADILGLVELENSNTVGGRVTALESLAVLLNRRIANRGDWYAAATEFDPDELTDGYIGGDAITVGFLYKPSKVKLVGKQAVLDEFDDPRFLTEGPGTNRPAVAATFKETRRCRSRFTLILNHLKSKGCGGAVGLDRDQNDGAGCYNPVRTGAARALVDLAKDFKRPIIMGDLNAYAKEDPIRTFEDAGYTNLGAEFEGEEISSFVFNGQRGTLDYALASTKAEKAVTGAASWLINSYEPDILSYDQTFTDPKFFDGTDPFRASDHDPLIIGLNMCVFDQDDDDDDDD